MHQEADPRTERFVETVVFIVVLLAVHLTAFIVARHSMNLLGGGYLGFVCLILPPVSLVATVVLRATRDWQWAQIAFVILLALVFSFVQLMVIGSASAAV